MFHAGAFSTRAGTAPPLFELPMMHKIYLSVMEFGLTFLFAMVVINCVLSILIDVYTGLRKKHQKEAAAAEKDDPFFMVHYRSTARAIVQEHVSQNATMSPRMAMNELHMCEQETCGVCVAGMDPVAS
jgi:hypothetical protein